MNKLISILIRIFFMGTGTLLLWLYVDWFMESARAGNFWPLLTWVGYLFLGPVILAYVNYEKV
jgi:hypothetical protein